MKELKEHKGLHDLFHTDFQKHKEGMFKFMYEVNKLAKGVTGQCTRAAPTRICRMVQPRVLSRCDLTLHLRCVYLHFAQSVGGCRADRMRMYVSGGCWGVCKAAENLKRLESKSDMLKSKAAALHLFVITMQMKIKQAQVRQFK